MSDLEKHQVIVRVDADDIISYYLSNIELNHNGESFLYSNYSEIDEEGGLLEIFYYQVFHEKR